MEIEDVIRKHAKDSYFPNRLVEKIISTFPREKVSVFDPKKYKDLKDFLIITSKNKEIECVIIRNQPHLPSEIQLLTNIKVLDIARNLIKVLPPELFTLAGLQVLDLADNKLDKLPKDIHKLTNLKVLEFARYSGVITEGEEEEEEIEDLFENISGASTNGRARPSFGGEQEEQEEQEEQLVIELTEFPIEVLSLQKLIFLSLANHRIQKLPKDIKNLDNLIALDLTCTSLTLLPNEMGKLSKLEYLLLGGNNLIELPIDLLTLVNLEELTLWGNESLRIPLEIIKKKSGEVLNFYYYRQTGKTKPLCEVKLLIVGQGSVGKTSLIKRTISNEYYQAETKTEGISINLWSVENQSDSKDEYSKIQLNTWDFGGQEIMHATHQFFLTKRSLYVLVLDSRLTQEENRVEYWLKIIQSFSDESPVLIVGNKIDQHPLDIDRTGLQKKYPNIVGILETSAATGTGIEALKAAIAEQVNNLPHVRDLLPETWFTVKTKLEELGRQSNFITHDKYLELCAENEVNDETSQRTLIGFLHDLGVVLYFQDERRLAELGILNPQWVTNGVYKILNDKVLFAKKGVLTLQLLDEILNAQEYPQNKRLFIVDMMKKFELCYDIEPDKSFLIPDLLPKDEPAELKFNGIPAFEYAYPVLPSSVITRFIVRMNQKIENGLVWRTGVVLKIGENKALVKADIEDHKITIAIDGIEHTRRDALSAIRTHLDDIHNSIKGLNPEKFVPVPGAEKAKPLPYSYLLMLEAKGIEILPVQDGDRLVEVNIRQVLSGVESEAQRKANINNVTNYYIAGGVNTGGGDFTGRDKSISAGDSSVVVGENMSGNLISGNYNKINSAEIAPELKETLLQLAEAVNAMIEKLPAEQASEVAEDFGKLADEAVKSKPNRKWYSVSIDGLIKAAENLDKLGTPVINLSQKVLSLLTGGAIK